MRKCFKRMRIGRAMKRLAMKDVVEFVAIRRSEKARELDSERTFHLYTERIDANENLVCRIVRLILTEFPQALALQDKTRGVRRATLIEINIALDSKRVHP